MSDEFVVNGLPLPPLIISLMQAGKWKHPGKAKLLEVIPFVEDDFQFCSMEMMHSESTYYLKSSDSPDVYSLFHERPGSKTLSAIYLPWLDSEKRIFIAVNAEQGADVAIALDYRTSMKDPRVVAASWFRSRRRHWQGFVKCFWREVTPTFSEFVKRLGLS